MRQVINFLLIFIFVLIISLPGFTLFFSINYQPDYFENRNHAKFPVFRYYLPDKIDLLAKALQQFFEDNFGFRSYLIAQQYEIDEKYLNMKLNRAYLLGKNGILFSNSIKDYSTVFFSNEELSVIKNQLEAEYNWFQEKKIPYFLVIAPDKESIYPEYYIQKSILSDLRLNQLEEYLTKNSSIKLVDLRKTLLSQKSPDIFLYYGGDNHWNKYGAFLGYQEIMNQFSKINPNVYVPKLSDFEMIDTKHNDKAVDLNIFGRDQDNSGVKFVPKMDFLQKNHKFKKIVIYGDSFFNGRTMTGELTGAGAYFPNSFVEYIPHAYIEEFQREIGSLSPIDYRKTLEEKPDLVIRETVQGNLRILLGPKFSNI